MEKPNFRWLISWYKEWDRLEVAPHPKAETPCFPFFYLMEYKGEIKC